MPQRPTTRNTTAACIGTRMYCNQYCNAEENPRKIGTPTNDGRSRKPALDGTWQHSASLHGMNANELRIKRSQVRILPGAPKFYQSDCSEPASRKGSRVSSFSWLGVGAVALTTLPPKLPPKVSEERLSTHCRPCTPSENWDSRVARSSARTRERTRPGQGKHGPVFCSSVLPSAARLPAMKPSSAAAAAR